MIVQYACERSGKRDMRWLFETRYNIVEDKLTVIVTRKNLFKSFEQVVANGKHEMIHR